MSKASGRLQNGGIVWLLNTQLPLPSRKIKLQTLIVPSLFFLPGRIGLDLHTGKIRVKKKDGGGNIAG